MAVFLYSACPADGDGALMRGTVAADSPRQARDHLRERGLLIHSLAEQPAVPHTGIWSRYLVRRQAGHITGFLQELATLLGAGLPLLEALDTITRQHTGRFQRTIMLIRDHVASGP